MTSALRPVPSYDLYGEEDLSPRYDLFHCETIRVRSQRYEWEISPHLHPGLSQVLFVASGKVELRLGRDEQSLSGPLLICVPAGVVHGFRFSPDVSGLVFTVAQAFVDGLVRQDALRAQLAKSYAGPVASPLVRRLLRLGRELLRVESERFLLNAHQLHRSLGEAWLRLALQPAGDVGGTGLVRRFQALVEAHYRSHRPLAFYADTLGCTIRTLSRQTGEALGATPLQIVNRRLLQEAGQLLRFTNASAADVAAELGFSDPSYFSRFYLRMTGQRPSAEKATVRRSALPAPLPAASEIAAGCGERSR
ncbi:MAG TPA: helix-turn-helix domain-containing protein [Sphingobium sp.]